MLLLSANIWVKDLLHSGDCYTCHEKQILYLDEHAMFQCICKEFSGLSSNQERKKRAVINVFSSLGFECNW